MNNLQINLDSNIDNGNSANKAFVYNKYGIEPSIFSIYEPDGSTMFIKSKFINELISKSRILTNKFSYEQDKKINTKVIGDLRDAVFLEYTDFDKSDYVMHNNEWVRSGVLGFNSNLPKKHPMYINVIFQNSENDTSFLMSKKKLPVLIEAQFVILYDSTNPYHLDALKNLVDKFNKNVIFAKYQTTSSYINLVVQENNQIKLKSYNIKKPVINLELSYGEEFANLYPSIVENITKEEKGLWIFHSDPGAGKSILIRSIIAEVNERFNDSDNEDARIIYLPSEMVKLLEEPTFIPFISQYPGSVLVIEDADIALQSREQYGRIVQTVLNLTDGILSDCLQIKIIATFNCALDKIDKALLRKGRLQLRHEFLNLDQERAIKLAESLGLDPTPLKDKESWSLADVYNLDKDPTPLVKKKTGFGFGSK